MSEWLWLLAGWVVLAVLLGVVLGRAIRTADRRELGRDRPDETLRPPDEDAA